VRQQYIFTIDAGRSGQASLAALLQRHVPDSYVAFEEPRVQPRLPGALGDIERRLRRQFVETDELLGRGRVLKAYDEGDVDYIDHIVAKRLRRSRRAMAQTGASIYIDVSKHFVRGLYTGFLRALPRISIIFLVRDPIENMRSYLNRDKRFTLDNNLPDARSNILRIDSKNIGKGELYLWAWCEAYLRYARIVEERNVINHAEIRTECLNDSDFMNLALDQLEIAHTEVNPGPRLNTNPECGYPGTDVTEQDIVVFERFLDRLPGHLAAQIDYFQGYMPRKRFKSASSDGAVSIDSATVAGEI